MIIIVSDLHLGYGESQKNVFLEFLDSREWNKEDQLILLGDIFDFWRRGNLKIIEENKEVLQKLHALNIQEINYIVGNHDYFLYSLAQRYGIVQEDQFIYGPFTVSKTLRIEENGQDFYFMHGYELEVFSFSEVLSVDMYEKFSNNMSNGGDLSGKAASEVWDVIQAGSNISNKIKEVLGEIPQKLLKQPDDPERKVDDLWNLANSVSARTLLLGMNHNEKLIFGHTHQPCISEMVVNTGAWIEEGKNSYLEIDDGKMKLRQFKGDNGAVDPCP